jgi:hypothetical protein
MIIFTSYIAIGAILFFGFFIDGVKKNWGHLNAVELFVASVLLLLLWGPMLIIEVIRRVYTK